MAKTISAKLDEEEKKIIDLIRQHKLDYIDVMFLFKEACEIWIPHYESQGKNIEPYSKRNLDKFTKLAESISKEWIIR